MGGLGSVGGIPVDEQLLALKPGQQRHGSKELAGLSGDSFQQLPHMAQYAVDRRRIEACAIVIYLEMQPLAGSCHDGQGIVRLLEGADIGDLKISTLLAEGVVDGVVFEDQDRIEKRRASGELAAGLDLHQRAVVVLPGLSGKDLDLLEPVEET